MAMDNKFGKAMLAGSSTRQKIIAAATIIIFIVLIWQIIGMFRGDGGGTVSSSAPAPAAQPGQMSAAGPTAGGTAVPGGAGPAPVVSPAAAVPPGQLVQISPLARSDAEILKGQQEQQKNYLDSLNQLQLLKIKRDIAETNQAIAAARLATATADKSMSDLLTQPTAPQVPTGAYAARLAGTAIGQIPGTLPEGAMSQLPAKPAPPPEPSYVVVSVSMQFNRWSAVLGSQGKLYNVSTGDHLADGSVVRSINRNGVTLEKEGETKRISLIPSI
ncbi:MAG: hypothetical protein ACD_60C00073G0003 [uncultured bacterium]|nr:MAG: hypothetical protein ACD_60C00073G0003 [uncultured bacterium]